MEFSEFKRRVHQHFGLNLDGYKEKQLKRRIDSLMQNVHFNDYGSYFVALQKDKEQLNRFLDKVTINVSEFFRNPDIFMNLEKKIIPGLLKRKSRLKIWSAACSNGCEPYSISIILEDLTPNQNHSIDATDIDKNILEVAQEGKYEERFLKNISAERLRKYFQKKEEFYVVNEKIKKRIVFKYQDLLTDRYDRNYDLIVCRNVTIYFTSEMQDKLYKGFFEALSPGGVLFIGATENMLKYRELGYEKISPWFYQKPF
ncbi:protein-glutamate O-methyltransferase CheR [Bacillota bacterium LX-D]|nr:protein-glutamate O-methyltransferase CheR [Bacillota bacterium LX-D]